MFVINVHLPFYYSTLLIHITSIIITTYPVSADMFVAAFPTDNKNNLPLGTLLTKLNTRLVKC